MSRQIRGLLLAALVFSGLSGWVPRSYAQQSVEQAIYVLTQPQRVVDYLQRYEQLPDYYITKKQARAQGWDAASGNLCQVLPGKAIGGDRFFNREKRLPVSEQRVWREADVNFQCGRRGADRLIYSNDGLIYLTRDHYKNFVRME